MNAVSDLTFVCTLRLSLQQLSAGVWSAGVVGRGVHSGITCDGEKLEVG